MSEGSTINTQAGKVQGSIEQSILGDYYHAFKGIPYAKPPVGQSRFKDPEPAEPWQGLRDCTKFGGVSAYYNCWLKQFEGGDDCLYLNVYVKNLEPRSLCPVMVWIHGGCFLYGSGNDALYGPDYFMRRDILLVTINYRLGVLGFLNLEDEVAPGNQGLKDQVMALKWIRANIANFGGDPNNVTIFGESAGGASVHYLSMSPMSKGLFERAICQSGVALNPWAHLTINPKRFAYQMSALLGCKERDPKMIVDFLRTVDSRKLIEIQEKLLTNDEKIQQIFPFGPGIDAKSENPFLPVHPLKAAEEGIQVPLMIGSTSREGSIFLEFAEGDFGKFNNNFEKILHPNTMETLKTLNITPEELKRFYYNEMEISNDNREKLIDLMGDVHIVEGIHNVLKTQIAKSSSPTYFYHYNFDKKDSAYKSQYDIVLSGAYHEDELLHLFRGKLFEKMSFKPLTKGTASYNMMERIIDLWVNFATVGQPTSIKTESIPIYWLPVNDLKIFRYLRIDENMGMDSEMSLEYRFSSYSGGKK